MTAPLLALILTSLFTVAALYVSLVESPARLMIDDRSALAEFQPSYRRGAAIQASLEIFAFLAALVAWWETRNGWFLAGALFQIAPWPWTLSMIMPTNHRLLALTPDQAGPDSRALLARWGLLHWGRSLWHRSDRLHLDGVSTVICRILRTADVT